MVFRKCSIGGKIYEGDDQPEDETQLRPKPADAPILSHQDRAAHISESEQLPFSGAKSSSDHTAVPNQPPADPSIPHFHDGQLQHDLHSSASEGSPYARTMNAFLTTLALCHTVLAATDDNGALQYKAQSPDEAALVQAAADCGFIFRGKDKETMRLQTPFTGGDAVEEYELLHVLDFTSARKRMSVIVRKVGDEAQHDNRVFLLCKGADSIVFDRLKEGPSDIRAATERHLEYFASSGTACFRSETGRGAHKVI
jgi:phospholipid-translocating ATPase